MITFGAYSKKCRVIYIDVPRFSVYEGVIITNITFELDFFKEKKRDTNLRKNKKYGTEQINKINKYIKAKRSRFRATMKLKFCQTTNTQDLKLERVKMFLRQFC